MSRRHAPFLPTTRRRSRRGTWLAVCGSLVLWTAGCQVDAVPLDEAKRPITCPCSHSDSPGQCPTSHCGIQIVIDVATCTGKVGAVEVMIDDTLEPDSWSVGAPRLSCAAIPKGGEAVVEARADTPWKWTSQPLKCTKDIAGTTIEHVLECKSGG